MSLLIELPVLVYLVDLSFFLFTFREPMVKTIRSLLFGTLRGETQRHALSF